MEASSPFKGLAFGAIASCLAEIGKADLARLVYCLLLTATLVATMPIDVVKVSQ
jgi:hypothetical protein